MKPLVKVIWHFIFWLSIPFIISFFIWAHQYTVFLPGLENQIQSYFEVFGNNSLLSLSTVLVGVSGFYNMYFWIIPNWLNKRKSNIILYFFILLFIPLIIVYLLSILFFAVYWSISFFILTTYLILIPFSVLGALLQMINYWRIQEKVNIQLEKQNLEVQLALLETQINPHFLFNTINNIDVLIERDAQAASAYLRKLSEILRFMLYRKNTETILLREEIEYLQKYIALQRMRSVNPNFVNFTIEGDAGNISIVPMLFIVFVENAFKHVANKKVDDAIFLQLIISPSQLFFKVRNVVNQKTAEQKKERGIGLAVAKKRLETAYSGKYDLKIQSQATYYSITLQIYFV
ncbi:MAG: histidine kinase [Bacteroidota bacterium]